MKRDNDNQYSGIRSFEDIRAEKSRLALRGDIIESRIRLDILKVRNKFSITALVLPLVRGTSFIPGILGIIGNFFRKSA